MSEICDAYEALPVWPRVPERTDALLCQAQDTPVNALLAPLLYGDVYTAHFFQILACSDTIMMTRVAISRCLRTGDWRTSCTS